MKDVFFICFSLGLSGQEFKFLSSGDGPARYRILNFRKNEDTGEYEWATVGFYKNDRLNIVGVYLLLLVWYVSVCAFACVCEHLCVYVFVFVWWNIVGVYFLLLVLNVCSCVCMYVCND